MATRKRTTPAEPPWQVILEDIRSQNRATIEAVEASRAEMNARFDQKQEAVDARFTVVEGAIRGVASDVNELKIDVKMLKTDVSSLKTDVASLKTDVAGLKTDVRRVEGKVDGLGPLEARVAALERNRR
jgi:chromosome segregation ATPase